MSIILESPASFCEEIGGAMVGVGILQGRSPTPGADLFHLLSHRDALDRGHDLEEDFLLSVSSGNEEGHHTSLGDDCYEDLREIVLSKASECVDGDGFAAVGHFYLLMERSIL